MDEQSIRDTEQLNRMMAAAAISRALGSLAELGVADHIADVPQSVAVLAKAVGAHERTLYRILRFTSSYGVFQELDDCRFAHTALSRKLRSDAAGSFRAGARMFHHIFAGWNGLHNAVVTGAPCFESVYGKGIFDYIGDHSDLAPIFDAGMTSIHGHETETVLAAYDFSDIGTLADIGGGSGLLLSTTLLRYPLMKGILFDLNHVIGRAQATIETQGVAGRCQIVSGSFFNSIPAGADAYILRHIIHDWTDEQSFQILSNIRKVIPEGGRLLLVEFAVPPANQAGIGKDADMIMLAFPGGMERTPKEYSELFRRAGFALTRVVPTASAVSVVEGRPV